MFINVTVEANSKGGALVTVEEVDETKRSYDVEAGGSVEIVIRSELKLASTISRPGKGKVHGT